MAHSIGPYTLRNWEGAPPPLIVQRVEVLSHAGVDHEIFRQLGERSPQIERVSRVDVASMTEGRTVLGQYRDLIPLGPHKIVWGSYDFDTENLRAQIQDVKLVSLSKKLLICGALTPGNLWDLSVRWTFRLVPYSP